MGHREEEKGDAGEEEEDKASTGTRERPGVGVLDPDGVLTLNHALDGLTHHLHRDDGAESWDWVRKEVRSRPYRF